MEGSHINGVAESEASNVQLPTDTSVAGDEVNGHDEKQKETMQEPGTETGEDKKQSFKFVVKTKTSVSSTEEDTEDKENETEGGKTYSYVLRSQTSVESHEETKDNPTSPPSNAKLKFKVRTQSTEEHPITEEHTTERIVDENGTITTTDEVFNDIGETQTEGEKEIAAKASEIVATILEKLEGEEKSKDEQEQQVVEEKSYLESAPDGVIVATAPAQEGQQISEDKVDKAEVERMKFETNEETVDIEEKVDVEALPAVVAATQEEEQAQEKEDKAEVVVMKFESNKEEEDKQEMVDVQTKTEEIPAAETAVQEAEEPLEDQEGRAEVLAMKFESREEKIEVEEKAELEQTPKEVPPAVVVATQEQPPEDQIDKAEEDTIKFESKEEKVEVDEKAEVEETQKEVPAVVAVSEAEQPSENRVDKAEVVAMKFETKEEKEEVEQTVAVEQVPKEVTSKVLEAEQPTEGQESKAEVLAVKFESREEKAEIEETADVENLLPQETAAVAVQKEQATNEDQEIKAEVTTMKFERKEEEMEVEEMADVETISKKPPEVVGVQGEQATNEDQEIKAEVAIMKFERKEEEMEVEETADVETTSKEPLEVVEVQGEQAINEEREEKADVVMMKFEKKEEEIEVEQAADVETTPEVPPEEQVSRAEVVHMKFELKEEKEEVEETAEVEVPAAEAAAVQEEEQPSEDNEGKAEVVAIRFESREEKIEVEEKAELEESPVAVVTVQEAEKPSEDNEGKAEIVAMKFETREEKAEVEETAELEEAQKEVPAATELKEEQPVEEQVGKAEVVTMKFESKEENVEVEERADVKQVPKSAPAQGIIATQKAEQPNEDQEGKEEKVEVVERADVEDAKTEISAAGTTVDEEAQAEIVTMKFESSEENVTKEETAFEEAKEAKIFVDAVKVGGEAAGQNEEQLSPKQEYVAERFVYKPQSQHEMQDSGGVEDSEELEEKPIIKVRLPEEPYQADMNEQEDNIIEVHGTEVDTQEIVTSPEFESQPAEAFEGLDKQDRNNDEEENDSDGEIEVRIRRFSQENQELIHNESDEDEDLPVDWMAKDDVDEVVFRGEALSPSSLEAKESDTKQQIDQAPSPTKKEDTHILVESGGKIYIDDVVVPDTREVEVCSGLENIFAPEELQEPEKVKVDDSVLDYDIDKDIEEERKRLESEKRAAKAAVKSIKVQEEVLANEFKRKEVSEFDIKLLDEKDHGHKETEEPRIEDEDEKPPSPLEAKEVKERGIKEIFETETYRRSGEFLSPVHEGDEYNLKDGKLAPEKKRAVVDEGALQASEQEKRCSLEWSLLDKWKEMELKAKRESLELEESKGEAKIQPEIIIETEAEEPEAAVDVSERIEKEPGVTEFEIRERDEPEVAVTETTETTPSSVSKVTTTKTVTKTRIIKARTEVQPETQTEVVEIPEKHDDIHGTTQEVPQVPKEEQEQPKTPSQEPPAPMSTILFRMDGTPIVIPPEPLQAAVEDKTVEESPKEESESVPEPKEEVAPMSTILFKMDGTPIVIPASPKTEESIPPSPKPKAVVFSGVRPQSLASVESVRGEHEGVPPLAGEEESDIDDSSLHLAKHAPGASRAPTVSPVKEVTSPEKGSQPDEDHEAESPLLDNSANQPGQKCCVIL